MVSPISIRKRAWVFTRERHYFIQTFFIMDREKSNHFLYLFHYFSSLLALKVIVETKKENWYQNSQYLLEQFAKLIFEFPKITLLWLLDPEIDRLSLFLGNFDFDDSICLFLFLFSNLFYYQKVHFKLIISLFYLLVEHCLKFYPQSFQLGFLLLLKLLQEDF